MALDSILLAQLKANTSSLISLNLSYQQLTASDIENLVEALKHNIYLTTLNLTGNQIEDEAAILLAQSTVLNSLSLSQNKITEKSVIILAQNPYLTELDISYNETGNLGICALARNAGLTSLNAAGTQIDDECVRAFADNTTLSHLVLTDNQISDEGALVLAQNKSLVTLLLSKNQIADEGAIALAQHPKLTTLSLSYNFIREKGGEALANNQVLTHLDISYNQIGATAAAAFTHNRSLHSLAIAGNQINNWGAEALAKNKMLTRLDLSYNQISDAGAKGLFTNHNLTELNLSYNQISANSVKMIVGHPSLKHLNLNHNLLDDESALLLAQSNSLVWLDVTGNQIGRAGAETMAKNTHLVTLALTSNLVDDEGAIALAGNTTLSELFLSYNQITDRGAIALAQNQNLIKLTVNYNHIGSEGRKALTQNKTFKLLEISDEQPPEFTSENISTSFLLSQDFICIRSKSGIIQFFNPAFSRVLGYRADELLAKPYQSFLHPADDHTEEQLLTTANHKFSSYYYENRYRCKDGSYRTIRWSSQTKNNRVYVIGTDITIQKQVEKELRNQENKKEIAAVIAKAAEMYTKEQADFIAHLCHEIRNPLSGIYGNLEIAQAQVTHLQTVHDGLGSVISPSLHQDLNQRLSQLNECLNAVEICTEHQKVILDDNLDLAKMAEKKFILEARPFDLKNALQDVVKMFKAKANQKNLRLALHLPEEEILVTGDSPRIKQIIVNLLGNAIKFTPSGQININVAIQKQTATDTLFEISITDTGVGMDEEELSQLFKRFNQASNTIGNQYGGSGLGLVIAKSLAQLMRGDVKVSSKKGEGSTFSCTFKCQNLRHEEKKRKIEEIPSALKSVESTSSSLPRKFRVLIVDDNEINQKALACNIKKAGYECLFAMNGQEAVNLYQNNSVDIILMDIIMPKMDGFEATQFIRSHEQEVNRAKVPIIALTGNALERDKSKAFEAGMDDYLTKPFKTFEVLEKISSWLCSSLSISSPQTERMDIEAKNSLIVSHRMSV